MRLAGKGLPRVDSGGRGNHFVKLRVNWPSAVSDRQRELLAEFDKIEREKKSGHASFVSEEATSSSGSDNTSTSGKEGKGFIDKLKEKFGAAS